MARYNTNGRLDSSFGTNGQVAVNSNIYDDASLGYIALQKDGKIVMGGDCRSNSNNIAAFLICRFNTNGSLDSTFNKTELRWQILMDIGNPEEGGAVVIQADGKLYKLVRWLYLIRKVCGQGMKIGR